MDTKEIQLEQVAKVIENYKAPKAPPVFELFTILIALSISILLFLLKGVFQQEDLFYVLMRSVLPQVGWAILYLTFGTVGAIGMLLDNPPLRIVSLCILSVCHAIVAAIYIWTFPNLAGILMFWIAIFTAASIPLVKYTGIRK